MDFKNIGEKICAPKVSRLFPNLCDFHKKIHTLGSVLRTMTFWCGSGSADLCLKLMDPDPAIFVIDLQDANKNCLLLFDGTFT
jgi:hypothetical protein